MIHEFVTEELMLELEEFIPVKSSYWGYTRNKLTQRYSDQIHEIRKEEHKQGFEKGIEKERAFWKSIWI